MANILLSRIISRNQIYG